VNETNLQACLLIYDIPERSGVRNPSRRLRSIAVRVNLSCRVSREGDVPYALLGQMAAGGATWHVVRSDADEGVKLVGMAVRALGDSAMANAAGADLVPAGVLADDIDERGGDASALRDAFAV
jgi:hypothetical protein